MQKDKLGLFVEYLSLILVKKTFLIECALIEWVEETGKFSVVLKADVFTTDVKNMMIKLLKINT
jgi:hypothetical protein